MSLSFPQRVRSSYALACALFAAALLAPTLDAPRAFARQGPQQPFRLERIEFKGLEKVKPEEALQKSGLAAGQSVTVDEVDAAANRLLESGVFRSLSYTVKGANDKVVLTFNVVEQTGGLPVAFDNFVWFTEDELREAVRRRVPAFDGTAPEAGGATEQIRQALQDLLRERKIDGTVEYSLSGDPSGRRVEHLFGVKGPGLRVCKITYQGARAVSAETLVQKSGGIFDNDYSRAYIAGFVESNLMPLYRERGYLRASFSPPKARVESSAECERGLAVSMYVDEGSVFVWNGAAWEGAQAFNAQELDAALGMRPREVANVAKVEKGLSALRRAYARKGYLAARVRGAQEFDDANRGVSYRFQVTEGPQYRMGELTIKGLSESDTNNLRGRWSLLHGDVYDEGYVEQFVKKSVREFMAEALRAGNKLPAFKIDSRVTPNQEKQTVDVTLEFKADPAAQPAATPAP